MRHQVTIACPEALMADANQLAFVTGYSEADLETFRESRWTVNGKRYAIINYGTTEESWAGAEDHLMYIFAVKRGASPLRVLPADPQGKADLTRAQNALGLLTIIQPGETIPALADIPVAVVDVPMTNVLTAWNVERLADSQP